MREAADIDQFITDWRDTGGSELANTQSFINGLCALLGVDAPAGSRTDDVHNDYVAADSLKMPRLASRRLANMAYGKPSVFVLIQILGFWR